MKIDKLYHGAAVYPEMWDESTFYEDIQHMKKVGINVVRIGEFLWSVLEPEEGKIDITPLIKMLDLCHKEDISVILCTPTCTPPVWMSDGHEERLYVDQNHEYWLHGARQHVCTNNAYFREKSNEITLQIAKAVANHPAVIMWQLDNEFKSHQTECCCETCKDMWHQWLKKRYGDIDALNKAWKTVVWSERYQSFEQVPQPFNNIPFIHNASLLTMYQLFSRDKIAEYAHMQAALIRRYSKAPITTNTGMGFALDNELLYSRLDAVSYDTYATVNNVDAYLINCDLSRGLKRDEYFWLMETSCSHGGAITKNPSPHPNGYLVSEAVAAYALGSASFNYWPWRQQPSGCELNHSAVLSAWGKPGVGYKNVLLVEAARKEIEPYILATQCTQGELAITYSDRAKVFMHTESHKSNNYRGLMTWFYGQAVNASIHRDVTSENTDLIGYKMLVTPFMFNLSDEYVARAKAFVEAGGIWLVGPMTGGRTKEHTINTDAGMNKMVEELAGIEVMSSYPIDKTGSIGEAFGIKAPLRLWTHQFEVRDAKVMGWIRGGITPDEPFISEKQLGKGKIVILASTPENSEEGNKLLQNIFLHYAKEAGIHQLATASEGTIVIPRHSQTNEKYLVVVNMDGKGGNINLTQEVYDVLQQKHITKGNLHVEPFGYSILKLCL